MKSFFTLLLSVLFVNLNAQDIKNLFTRTLDFTYTNIYWEIDPEIRYIKGSVEFYIKKTNYLEENIDFDLSSNLIVDSIVRNSKKIEFEHKNDKILINNQSSDSFDTITIFYSGIPANSGFDTFTKDLHRQIPIIWTLSEPYGAADWWPCRNNLNDKSDSLQVAINCPKPYTAISNGLLINTIKTDSSNIFVWKHNHPISTYLIAFAVTNYAKADLYFKPENQDSVLIENYVFPEDSASALLSIKNLEPAFNLFCEKYGSYPFADEKYGHAQFGWGGGMEHQTISFVSNFDFYLLTHELAHQWFGDYITCGSFKDVWLNEGFAVFSEALATEVLKGKSDFLDWKKYRIERITSQPGGSVFVDDTTNIWRIFDGRLSYSKAGMVLQMLRTQVGDSAFFEAIRNYLNDPQLANNYAFTNDIRKHFEASSQTDLTSFFNEWIYGEGFPIYNINYWLEGDLLKIFVHQESSKNKTDFFHLNLPFLIRGENKDSLIYLKQTENNQSYHVKLNFKVKSLVFNPFYDIIALNNTTKINLPEQHYILFPNPVQDTIFLLFDGEVGEYNIRIFNVNGKQYLTKKGLADSSITIDVSSFPSGKYFINLQYSNQNIKTQFIKN